MNPTEMLPVMLKKLVAQKSQFDDKIPEDKDLGLMRVEFKSIKMAIKDQPKKLMQMMKDILPQMVKSRIWDCKIWL